MTYQNDDRYAVVKHIQSLLRSIQINCGDTVTVPIDGIYRSSTVEAVREFQKKNGLKPTGNVDKATYDLLYEHSLFLDLEKEEPLPLFIFKSGQSVKKGEISDFVTVLQILLNELTISYDDYSPLQTDGVFGEQTEKAVRRFQMRNGISPTGVVDKVTWNSIVRNYNQQLKNI